VRKASHRGSKQQ